VKAEPAAPAPVEETHAPAKIEAAPPPKPVAPATPPPVQTIPAVVHQADPEQNFGFASGKSGLSDAQKKQIAAWADAYKASGSREMISVSGHADTVGNPDRNKALSAKRAQSVADCLKENGIDPARIRTAAYGSDPAHLPHKTVGPVSDASNRCARLTMGDHAQPSQTFARERPAQRPRNRIIFDDLHPATNKAAEANKTPPMQTAKADSKSPRLQAPSA
jgi:outer membrane protein OmpA-like peptidoglycan-associated protein